jgi:transposase
MRGDIVMSQKESLRIGIMEKLGQKTIKLNQAARELNLSIRQVKRLKRKYREKGLLGLVHGNRGKESNHKIPEVEIERAITIVKEQYWDFGPLLALEKLKEFHEVTFGKETLRKAMIVNQIWKPKRQRLLVVHQRRQRRASEGELVQLDGSPHDWFEERGKRCTLLVFIDDATGKLLHLEFCQSESLFAYFKAVKSYLLKQGKPLAFYVDKHVVFRVNTKRNETAGVEDSNGITEFGRAMEELSIDLIFANSAEAKGRVEKVNQTLQDRLVKELRLKGISTTEEANQYLPQFIKSFNQKFAVAPRSGENAHRKLTKMDDLEKILVVKNQRTLSKNLEVQYKNKAYQIQTQRPRYAMRKRPVTLTEDLEGRIRIYYQGKELAYQILEERPKSEIFDSKNLNLKVDQIKKERENVIKDPKVKWIPPENHPWRKKGTFLFGQKGTF